MAEPDNEPRYWFEGVGYHYFIDCELAIIRRRTKQWFAERRKWFEENKDKLSSDERKGYEEYYKENP